MYAMRSHQPSRATRCDCGYDFQLQKVARPYFEQKFPRDLKVYLVIVVVANLILAAVAFATGDLGRVILLLFWSGLVYWLLNRLLHRQNWARVALIFVTFPVGLLFLLSRDLRLYCLQASR